MSIYTDLDKEVRQAEKKKKQKEKLGIVDTTSSNTRVSTSGKSSSNYKAVNSTSNTTNDVRTVKTKKYKASDADLKRAKKNMTDEEYKKYRITNGRANIVDKVRLAGKQAISGFYGGLEGIVDTPFQSAQESFESAEKENFKEMGKNAVKDTIEGLIPIISQAKYQKKASDITKDKDKKFWDKITGALYNAVKSSDRIGTTYLLDAVLKNAARAYKLKTGNKLSEKAKKVQESVDSPFEDVKSWGDDEYSLYRDYNPELYGEGINYLNNISYGVGNVIPSLAATVATKNPNIGLAVTGVSAKGAATNEALKKGADIEQANAIGLAKGGIEAGTEKLSGGLNFLGKGALDDIAESAVNTYIKKKGANFLAKKALGMAGEIGEETLSDILNTAIDRDTIDPNAKYSLEDWKNTAISTAGTTAVLNALGGGYTPRAYRQNSIQVQQAQNIINQKNSGKIDAKQATEMLKQVQEGTFNQNQNIEQIAKERVNEITNNPNLSQGQKADMINAVTQTVQQQRDNISSKAQNTANNESLEQSNAINQETKKTVKNSPIKQKQFDIIQKSNPMTDDYHVGIRNENDIKTFDEVINDEESFNWGDFTKEDAKKALNKGEIKIYSSNDIKNGTFVSTSYQQAYEYAGRDASKVKSKIVPLENIAWINGDEGQYVKVESNKSNVKNNNSNYKYRVTDKTKSGKDVFNAFPAREEGTKPKLTSVEGKISTVDNIKVGTYYEEKTGKYVTVDLETGLKISDGKTQKSSINNADKTIKEKNSEGFDWNKTRENWFDRLKISKEDISNKDYLDIDTNIPIEEMVKEAKSIEELNKIEKTYEEEAESIEDSEEYQNRTEEILDAIEKRKFELQTNDSIHKNTSESNSTRISESSNEDSNSINQRTSDSSFSNDTIAETKSDNVITAKEQTKILNDAINNSTVFDNVQQEQGKPIRGWVRTATTETGTTELVNSMNGEKITYEPTSNKKNIERGTKLLEGLDYKDQVSTVKGWLRSNQRVSAEQVAATELVLKDAISRGDSQTTMELIEDASIMATEAGQTIQALSLIRNASPTGQLQMLKKIIQREQIKGNKTYQGVEIKENLVKDVLDSYNKDGTYNQEQFDNAMDALKQDVADQMKVTPLQKLNNWRHLSMLGNPKTHIRNIVANVAMQITSGTKNKVGAVGEAIVNPFVKDMTRTKTLKKATQEISDFSKEYTETYFDANEFHSKYNDNTQRGLKGDIESRVKSFSDKWFGGKLLNKASDWNAKALDVEDIKFNKSTVNRTFKNALTANGLTTKADIEANPELVNTCFEYAIQQGKEVTFHQDSKTSTAIAKAKEKLSNGSALSKTAYLGLEATMPYVKTPVNIAKTGIEYTPGLGMATTIDNFVKAPQNMKGAVLIDGLSKQFTGGVLAAIGYSLVKSGVLKGATGNDKKDELEKNLGVQGYSLKIGNNTYDLSWLSPSAMPLFVGAGLYDVAKNKGIKKSDIENALFSTIDPLTEMSFISSVQNALQSYSQGGQQLGDMLKSMGTSYVTQYIPTLLSQIANYTDDKQRSTKADGFTDTLKKQIMYKIPGARQKLDANTNVWGEEKKNAENKAQRFFEAFLSPANRKSVTIDATTKELERLYDETGSGLPNTSISRTQSINQEKYRLNSKESNNWKVNYGKTAKKNLDTLLKSNAYKNADDETREKMVSEIYKYSNYESKKKYAESKNIELNDKTKNKTFDTLDKYSIPVGTYTSARLNDIESDFDSNGNAINGTKKQKLVDTIEALNLTRKQKDGLIENKVYSQESDKKAYKFISNFGISADTYTDYIVELNNIKADKNSNGKTISGSRKKKVMKYIESLPLSSYQKAALFKKQYKSYKAADSTLYNYINSLDLTVDEKKEMAKYIGFKVK